MDGDLNDSTLQCGKKLELTQAALFILKDEVIAMPSYDDRL